MLTSPPRVSPVSSGAGQMPIPPGMTLPPTEPAALQALLNENYWNAIASQMQGFTATPSQVSAQAQNSPPHHQQHQQQQPSQHQSPNHQSAGAIGANNFSQQLAFAQHLREKNLMGLMNQSFGFGSNAMDSFFGGQLQNNPGLSSPPNALSEALGLYLPGSPDNVKMHMGDHHHHQSHNLSGKHNKDNNGPSMAFTNMQQQSHHHQAVNTHSKSGNPNAIKDHSPKVESIVTCQSMFHHLCLVVAFINFKIPKFRQTSWC